MEDSSTQKAPPVIDNLDTTVHEKPDSRGIFVRNEDKFIEIDSGALSDLMQTNAKRGFGFGQPVGKHLFGDIQNFTILDKSIHAEQLQITMFNGVAVNSDSWFSEVSDSNTAWIPSKPIQSKIKIINSQEGFAELTIQQPLQPGFYVLHDYSLMKSTESREVSFYYPFIVESTDKKDFWIEDADTCFQEILDKYRDHVSLEEFDPHENNDVKKCASKQRLAWKAQTSDASENEFKLRLIYLSRLIDASSEDVHRAILENMDETGSETRQLLWKVEQYDQLQRLNLLAQNKGNSDIIHAVLQYYQNDNRETSIKTLHWMPFLGLESDDEALEAYFNDICLDNDWEHSLIELLGAIQYKQLFAEAGRHKTLAPWLKQIDGDVAKEFKEKSVTLSFRHAQARTVVGPMSLTGVSEADVSMWRATLKTFEKDVRACAAVPFKGSYTLILEQPLTGDIYGHASRGIIRDPVQSIRKGVVPPPEILDCILDVYSKLPASAAIDVDQKATIAISISH